MRIYTKRLMPFLVMVFSFMACGIGTDKNYYNDNINPAVSSTIPLAHAAGVAVNAGISVTFSELINPSSVNTATFTLTQGAVPVAGSVTCTGAVAVFRPSDNLAFNKIYTAAVTTGVMDEAGRRLTADLTWTFTTGASLDTIAPVVGSIIPSHLVSDVNIDGNITAYFSEGMDPLSVNTSTFTLKHGDAVVSGAVECVGMVATFNPTFLLVGLSTYTATITTGTTDLAGNPLAETKIWNFKTGAMLDVTAPLVISTFPSGIDPDVPVNANITATFNEGMTPLSINSTNFILTQGSVQVAGVVTLAGSIAIFNPSNDMLAGTQYSVVITRGVTDLAGNHLAVDKTWSFITGTAAAAGPASVSLGTAGSYVVLSEAGITNIPPSQLTGNIGVSPIAATAITGFSLTLDSSGVFSLSSQVIGSVYAAGYAGSTPSNLAISISNMQSAYTEAAYRSNPDFTNLYSGEIGGQILPPGLYKWTTGISITSDVTLNGGPNDVWILQSTGGINIASGMKVLLTGGARPENIFWQSANTVNLNSGAHIEGIVLSKTNITLGAGASVNGRLLAQTSVTLQSNTVTRPAQ